MNKQEQEIWDLYNRRGECLNRTVPRGTRLNAGEYHIVVQVWVKNSLGAYLIQKRAEDKEKWPGIWATTAGAVLAGEAHRSGAVRELHEELGLIALPNELRFVLLSIKTHSISAAWLLERDVKDDEITLQEEEVSAIRWANQATITGMIQEGTFYDYGADYLERLFQI